VARPVPGRPPKLTGQQMRTLYTLIVGADPRQYEFEFALWTREMVRALIRREFTESLSAVSVGRLLRTLGLSPQRPLWRALAGRPRGRSAVEGRGVPGHPRAGQGGRGDGVLRR
jgi:transposase